jgi:2-C-methyl-D-erythritol 4-phosphate cytidylyltransferase
LKATGLIAAAGSGQRLGAGGPKAFVEVAGRPMVEWCIDAFRGAERVGEIVVAVPAGATLDTGHPSLEVRTVDGGDTRAESVARAMETVDGELVAVHDAARPLVTAELIDAVLEQLESDPECDAVVPAAPVTDTIKQVARGMEVDSTLDRSALWAAQTPQAFRAAALREALASTRLLAQATDEAMLLERIGRRVVLHESPAENLKVTTPLDLRLAESLLAERR